jgi:hypothetical protein
LPHRVTFLFFQCQFAVDGARGAGAVMMMTRSWSGEIMKNSRSWSKAELK